MVMVVVTAVVMMVVVVAVYNNWLRKFLKVQRSEPASPHKLATLCPCDGAA